MITDRDVPVAKLESIQRPIEGEVPGRIERLVRSGVARGPIKALPKNWHKQHPRIKVPPGMDVVKIVVDERESGW